MEGTFGMTRSELTVADTTTMEQPSLNLVSPPPPHSNIHVFPRAVNFEVWTGESRGRVEIVMVVVVAVLVLVLVAMVVIVVVVVVIGVLVILW